MAVTIEDHVLDCIGCALFKRVSEFHLSVLTSY